MAPLGNKCNWNFNKNTKVFFFTSAFKKSSIKHQAFCSMLSEAVGISGCHYQVVVAIDRDLGGDLELNVYLQRGLQPRISYSRVRFLSGILASEKRDYICNVFSHWFDVTRNNRRFQVMVGKLFPNCQAIPCTASVRNYYEFCCWKHFIKIKQICFENKWDGNSCLQNGVLLHMHPYVKAVSVTSLLF